MRFARSLSTEGLSRASALHPKLTITLWGLLLVISGLIASRLLPGALTTQAEFTNQPESKQAQLLLEQRFPERDVTPQPNETIIVRSDSLTVDDPAFRLFLESLHARLLSLGPDVIQGGVHYYLTRDPSLVSADRHTTILPLIVNEPNDNIGRVQQAIHNSPTDPAFQVYTVGSASFDKEFLETAEKDLSAELRIGLPAAIVVLVLVFGAVVSALVPVVVAFISIAVALALTALIGQAFPFSFFVTNMIVMMGLAVGIDYSLFILSRFREERRNGLDKINAISAAGATASRAVLFSGLTVVLALLGMLLVPTNIFRSLGAGAILVVLVSITASVTLLPAIVSLLGDSVNALRLPRLGRALDTQSVGGFWDKMTSTVMRFPVGSLVAAIGLLVAAAIPAMSIETGFNGIDALPDHLQSKQGFLILQQEFQVGSVSRAVIVVDGEATSPQVQQAIQDLQTMLASDPAFFLQQATTQVNPRGDLTVLRVPMAGDSSSRQAEDAIRRLRGQYIPQAFHGVPARALVTGNVAGNLDFFDLTADYTPIVFAFVLGLSFILLTTVFRSLVVPVKAILMNLLSVGAAYGLMVLVFQDGFLASTLGFGQVDKIEAWIPLFLFSVLFGLSMDYHVFLLSRIRERFDQTRNNDGAVAFGLRSTASIITGAALIMVAVFAGFASGDMVMFQQVGFGLAVAVFLDATIVRSVLVPSAMKLLGDRNWYLPQWLSWLPSINTGETYPGRPVVPQATPAGPQLHTSPASLTLDQEQDRELMK